MKTRFGNRGIAGVLLAMLILVPVSVSYAGDQRVDKLVELAERAKEKTQILINMTYLNATAMEAIEDAGFLGEFEDNMTLFNEAALNITNPEYHNVGNLTLALGVFREVYKSINRILAATPEVQRGQLVDAQGLLQAMTRALDRIERLGEIGELPDEAIEALNYLDAAEAILWLQEGRVEDVTENLTTANRLIADAHRALKDVAKEMNANRVRNYFEIMNKTCERLNRSIGKLGEGPEKEGLLDQLGEAQQNIEHAREQFENEGSIDPAQLEGLRNALGDIEDDLKAARKAEKGNGNGNGGA